MPITIGSLANVPNAGSPITSPWAQDSSRLLRHVFATKAALDAAVWPGLADGHEAWTTDTGKRWVRMGGTWYTPNQKLYYYRHTGAGALPVGTTPWPLSAAIAIPAGRLLRITGKIHLGLGSGTSTMYSWVNGAAGADRLWQNAAGSATQAAQGSAVLALAAGNYTFSIAMNVTSVNTHHSDADASWILVEDIGSAA